MLYNFFSKIRDFSTTGYAGITLALIGFAGVLVGTASYGPGMSSDSVFYLSCARNLVEGQGFMSHIGVFTRWPPLFPLSLAFFGWLGIDVVDASRFFNAACYSLAIFAYHHLLRRNIHS